MENNSKENEEIIYKINPNENKAIFNRLTNSNLQKTPSKPSTASSFLKNNLKDNLTNSNKLTVSALKNSLLPTPVKIKYPKRKPSSSQIIRGYYTNIENSSQKSDTLNINNSFIRKNSKTNSIYSEAMFSSKSNQNNSIIKINTEKNKSENQTENLRKRSLVDYPVKENLRSLVISPIKDNEINNTPTNNINILSKTKEEKKQKSKIKLNSYSNSFSNSNNIGPYFKTILAKSPSSLRNFHPGGSNDPTTKEGTNSMKVFYLKYQKDCKHFEEIYFKKINEIEANKENEIKFYEKKYNNKNIYKVQKNLTFFKENKLKLDEDPYKQIRERNLSFVRKSKTPQNNLNVNLKFVEKLKTNNLNYKEKSNPNDKSILDNFYKNDNLFRKRMKTIISKKSKNENSLEKYQKNIVNILNFLIFFNF